MSAACNAGQGSAGDMIGQEIEGNAVQGGAAGLDDDWTSLPNGVAQELACSFVTSGPSLVKLGQTCHLWHDIASDEDVWRELIRMRFGVAAVPSEGKLAQSPHITHAAARLPPAHKRHILPG